jgi:hypothetical protein
MAKANSEKKKDAELRECARTFIQSYFEAAAKSRSDVSRIIESGNFELFEGGAVELNEEVQRSLSKFIVRAEKLLGAKAGSQNAIRDLARRHGQDHILGKVSLDQAVTTLIDTIFEPSSFEFLVPKYLFQFLDGVRSVRIGRVRAMMTADYAAELGHRNPEGRLQIASGQDFSLRFVSDGTVLVEMRDTCWVTSVDAASEHVEEESKWLIDVAVSFLRLSLA